MEKEKKSVALSSVFAAIFLTGFKLVIGLLTGSLGILSEALHSGLDLVAAVITYFTVRVSDKPADKKHHFGHGKIENMSALIQTFLLLITCIWIVYEALSRLISGNTHIEINSWSYIVVISSIIVDVSRSRALYRVAKKYNSHALEADALHFSTDIWSSAVVGLGLICANFGFFFADAIAALVVAMIVIFISYKLGRKSIDMLLDKAPQESYDLVDAALVEFEEVRHFHNLRIRSSGADTFIKVSIHFDSDLSLKLVHEICNKIETKIASKIPRCEVFIHAEPHDKEHIQSEKTKGN